MNIETIWNNIKQHEGEMFYTVEKRIAFSYVVNGNYIIVNNDPRRKISKEYFEKALNITNPTPSRINLRGQSYICAIITDRRILL